MADGVWKGVQPQVIGHFKQLSLNKFFDPSTPSMRKGRDGEWNGGKKWKIMVKQRSTNVIASRPYDGDRLQRRRSCPNPQTPSKKRRINSLFWYFLMQICLFYVCLRKSIFILTFLTKIQTFPMQICHFICLFRGWGEATIKMFSNSKMSQFDPMGGSAIFRNV